MCVAFSWRLGAILLVALLLLCATPWNAVQKIQRGEVSPERLMCVLFLIAVLYWLAYG